MRPTVFPIADPIAVAAGAGAAAAASAGVGTLDAAASAPPLLAVHGLVKRFALDRSPLTGRARSWLHAVDDVSFSIAAGESVGLVGESGCGKSTLSRLVARLADPDAGAVRLAGRDLATVPARRFAADPARRDVQVVFQDPTDALNPRETAFDAIAAPLRRLCGITDRAALERAVAAAATDVGIAPELLGRLPHRLSGGQKARVGIARAVAVAPKLLILDEPTAALDVSVQAVVLRLLARLRERHGLAFLFVSHDLQVVRLVCDRVLVMYLGRVVESGPAAAVFDRPLHPYTRSLVEAIPRPLRGAADADGAAGATGLAAPASAPDVRAEPDAAGPVDPDPNRCRFAPRCPHANALCATQAPALRTVAPGRAVACHLAA